MTFYTGKGKGGYVPGRDSFVDEVMHQWRNRSDSGVSPPLDYSIFRYSTVDNLSICVSTFNVNGKLPGPEVKEWLESREKAHLYVIG